jgi:hypothetical protein
MSTITREAELEAAIAEAELTDEEAELAKGAVAEGLSIADAIAAVLIEREPAPAPPAEQPGELGEPSDKQLRALDAEQARHEKRVHEIMGGHVAGFVTCEACAGVGLVPPEPPGPELKEHEWFQTCETCNGYGKVKTGSLSAEHALRNCPGCGGRGYLEAIDASGAALAGDGNAAQAPPPLELAAPPAVEPAPGNGGAPELRFGRPSWMGDPTLGQ